MPHPLHLYQNIQVMNIHKKLYLLEITYWESSHNGRGCFDQTITTILLRRSEEENIYLLVMALHLPCTPPFQKTEQEMKDNSKSKKLKGNNIFSRTIQSPFFLQQCYYIF